MKYVLIIFASFILGYGSYSFFHSTSESEQIKVLETELEKLEDKKQEAETKKLDLKKELKEITFRDFIEYQNLKDKKKKFEKANDVFGKVMMLFLAYLDLNQLKPEVDKFVAKNNQLSVGEKRELEVIIDPFKDQPKCPICPSKENPNVVFQNKKYQVLKSKKEVDKFLQFRDKLEINHPLRNNLDIDIYIDFKAKNFSERRLVPMNHDQVQNYLGNFDVTFRTESGLEETGEMTLSLGKDSKSQDVRLNVAMNSMAEKIQVVIKGDFQAQHPASHQSTSGSQCRGFLLESFPYEIFLVNLRFKPDAILGKIVSHLNSNKNFQIYFLAVKKKADASKSNFGQQ